MLSKLNSALALLPFLQAYSVLLEGVKKNKEEKNEEKRNVVR